MLNIELIKNVLIVAIGASIVTTAFVQKIKEAFKFKASKRIICVSFLISLIIGSLFSIFFSDLSKTYAFWVGLFSFLGADALYKAFEDKIFKKFSDLDSTTVIDREDKK